MGPPGTYAFELKQTCVGCVINQRMRLEVEGGKGSVVQRADLADCSRAGTGGNCTSSITAPPTAGRPACCVAMRPSTPRSRPVVVQRAGGPVGCVAQGARCSQCPYRATIQHAKAEDGGFDTLFFYGEKMKPPQSADVVVGRVPKRLADFKLPEGAEPLTANRARIYYRGAFFEADPKGQTGEAGRLR